MVDQRRERRALAAAGRAGDEHEPALFVGDLLQDRRQPELVDGANLHRDDAEDEADRAALLEDVDAEASQARHAVGEVDFLRFLELLPLRRRHDRRAHRDDVFVVEAFLFGRRQQRAADAHQREAADLQVQVGCAALDGDFQEIVDMHAMAGVPIAWSAAARARPARRRRSDASSGYT